MGAPGAGCRIGHRDVHRPGGQPDLVARPGDGRPRAEERPCAGSRPDAESERAAGGRGAHAADHRTHARDRRDAEADDAGGRVEALEPLRAARDLGDLGRSVGARHEEAPVEHRAHDASQLPAIGRVGLTVDAVRLVRCVPTRRASSIRKRSRRVRVLTLVVSVA
ncbi:MAG: hypothetical protein AVDCRST_MAG85-4009 [uncultured Solirubrobacteraceae bacterium]|uniref:Uncharacterized protein n=1 Tax=uncultured Solirubrobacteraceae bacterium TaxID=1162706 RepID=A0A6J4TZH2_9ACTN|nr:MAG: hypothetical protein AVDCRST_MAG85-4009 [uncultured Solirubrobacteraceae bacterium]